MSSDKHQESKDKPLRPAEANSDAERHGHISAEDQSKYIQHEKQKDPAVHDHMVKSGVLPAVEIDKPKHEEAKAKSEQKGFWTGLVDGISNTIANAEKTTHALIDGAKHGLDDTMKKAGVPDEVRKEVNAGVNQVAEVVKDPEKAVGQMLDDAEAALDQGMKDAGVSNDARKNVGNAIHTIRRIDEAELKLLKGIGKGTQKMVGDVTHMAAGLAAETLDKADQYKKANPLDVTGVVSTGVAAAETLGKAAVNALGAAEKFGEQLRKDSDKVGGLDKLAAKKAQEAGNWIAETNIENLGQKAEQTGEAIPEVAALALGGAGLAKSVGKVAETLNNMRKGAQVAEAAEAAEVATVSGAASESTSAMETVKPLELKTKLTIDGSQYSLYEDGTAVVETATGELKKMNYVKPWSDSETAIMYAENATPAEMLNNCLVVQLDEGMVTEGLLKGGMYGSEIIKDAAAFEQALGELPAGSKLVGVGHQRIAFATADGEVTVLGPVTERQPCPLLTQPVDRKIYSSKVQAERYPKVDTTKVLESHIKQVEKDMHDAGWEYDSDPNAGPANFGLDKEGNPYLIDPEDVIGRKPLVEINPELADPVYRKYIDLAEGIYGANSQFVSRLWQDLADLHKAHQQFDLAEECMSHVAGL